MFTQDVISSENWRSMVTLYTQKDLTYQTDILPALSGITNRVRGAGKYYGGLWERSLPYDLLWFPTVASSSSSSEVALPTLDYIAPSFLWASLKGSISFVNITQTTREFDKTFAIKQISLNPEGEDPLGRLSDANLILEAPTLTAKFVCNFDSPMAADFFVKDFAADRKCLWAVLELEIGGHYIFHPDYRHDLECNDLICLQLFAHNDPKEQRCYALVLSPRSSEPPEISGTPLQRIGIIASLEKWQFNPKLVERIWIE